MQVIIGSYGFEVIVTWQGLGFGRCESGKGKSNRVNYKERLGKKDDAI